MQSSFCSARWPKESVLAWSERVHQKISSGGTEPRHVDFTLRRSATETSHPSTKGKGRRVHTKGTNAERNAPRQPSQAQVPSYSFCSAFPAVARSVGDHAHAHAFVGRIFPLFPLTDLCSPREHVNGVQALMNATTYK